MIVKNLLIAQNWLVWLGAVTQLTYLGSAIGQKSILLIESRVKQDSMVLQLVLFLLRRECWYSMVLSIDTIFNLFLKTIDVVLRDLESTLTWSHNLWRWLRHVKNRLHAWSLPALIAFSVSMGKISTHGLTSILRWERALQVCIVHDLRQQRWCFFLGTVRILNQVSVQFLVTDVIFVDHEFRSEVTNDSCHVFGVFALLVESLARII